MALKQKNVVFGPRKLFFCLLYSSFFLPTRAKKKVSALAPKKRLVSVFGMTVENVCSKYMADTKTPLVVVCNAQTEAQVSAASKACQQLVKHVSS
jgi:hypothetical protein